MFSHLTELSQAFGNTSNPQHLLRSQTHASALSLLSEVLEDGRNIRVLIGEPGTGKTILLLRFLEQFQDSALTAHLFWTQLGRGEFLHYFLHELGVLHPPDDIGQAQKQLNGVLEREFGQGRKVIVAIDEAHNLEVPALRGLAELLDGSLARSKELEVVLAGLPHLAARLASPELRGMWDRISAIASLSPLTADETASYINRRLEASGHQGDGPFTSDAMATIATLSEGIPRNINNICFAALNLNEKRACSVIDSAMLMEAAAQWEGRLATQETTRGSIASSANLPTAQHVAAHDQQTSGCEQQYISAIDATNPTPFGETSGNTVADEVWVDDQAIATVPDSIRQWFGKHRVAWSGTVGELAAALDQPETEVVHALHANSEILRSSGVAVSVCETVGRTLSVSLRRLQERKQTTAEEANTGPKPPESEVDASQDFAANGWPTENLPSQGQSTTGLVENVQIENAPAETASVSPADQALDLLRANCRQHIVKTRVSGSRWAVLALSITLVALTIGLGGRYSPVLKRKAQESPHAETVPPISASAQTLSGIRVLEEDGGRQNADKATNSFQQAALSGDPNAQLELGTAYALGRGVPADPVIGYTWLTLAFANGDQEAETLIRDLTRKLSQPEIARIRWNLGEMYANGVGVHSDKVTAYMWHLLAESAGETRSTIARSHLASTMTDDERSEANARASQWLRRHHK
jgi:general secretion pathway protein A